MQQVRFRLRGISPLLTHNPAGMGQNRGSGKKKTTPPPPEEEAEANRYLDEEGRCCIPGLAPFRCLLSGCKGLKSGKVGLRTVVQGAVMADYDRELLPLLDPASDEPWTTTQATDVRRVVIRGSGAILRGRPRWDDWAVDVDLTVDESVVPL
ncbi:MAG: hypothetical protein R6X20_04870 [Phycisphaerae bacterium]